MTPLGPDSPPRIPEALIRLLAGRDHWAEIAAGDLREEYAAVQGSHGRQVARLWYWGQGTLLLGTFLGRTLRRALTTLVTLVRPEGDHVIRTLFQEFRFACRSLVRQPLVTGIVLLTLALGLGANAATFGMIDTLLLRPFPIEDVDRLILISENSAADPYPQETVSPRTSPISDARRARSRVCPPSNGGTSTSPERASRNDSKGSRSAAISSASSGFHRRLADCRRAGHHLRQPSSGRAQRRSVEAALRRQPCRDRRGGQSRR